VIVAPVPVGGSPNYARYEKPPAYPQQGDQRWPLNQTTIPGPTRVELQREVQRALSDSKVQIEALRRIAP
jgi:hypothetical protein